MQPASPFVFALRHAVSVLLVVSISSSVLLYARVEPDKASPYVPIYSWVYGAFDRLQALGFAPSAFVGLRPWTRMECARIVESVGELQAGYDRSSEAHRLYSALVVEFASELDASRDSSRSDVRVDSIYARYTGIARLPLADGYHFGQTLANDFGRPYGEGANTVLGAAGWASSGPIAMYVRAEYQHAAPLPPYSDTVQQLIGQLDLTPPQLPIQTRSVNRAQIVDAYAAWNLRTVQVSVGRQSLWWGPNRTGPLMLSNNANPIDMVRVTKTTPWKLPSFLGWLGPVRWEGFFGLLADHHYPENPAIHGEKVSFKPTPNLELGFSRTVVFRPVTFGKFWDGFVSVGDSVSTIPGGPTDVGDRRGGFDFAYRVPGLRRWLVLYNDALTDDDPSPLSAPQRSMMNPGLYMPQVPKIPKLEIRVEAPFSDTPALAFDAGHFFYWNGAYRDSYTNGGKLLGSWVGRQGRGLQAWTTYSVAPRKQIECSYRQARIDGEFVPGGGRVHDFRVGANWTVGELEISSFVQHELWTVPVLRAGRQSNTTASIQLTYAPSKWSLLANRRR